MLVSTVLHQAGFLVSQAVSRDNRVKFRWNNYCSQLCTVTNETQLPRIDCVWSAQSRRAQFEPFCEIGLRNPISEVEEGGGENESAGWGFWRSGLGWVGGRKYRLVTGIVLRREVVVKTVRRWHSATIAPD